MFTTDAGVLKLQSEARVYENRQLWEENIRVNDLHHQAMKQERQALMKAKEKDERLASKEDQLLRTNQTLQQIQAQLRQTEDEKDTLREVAECPNIRA